MCESKLVWQRAVTIGATIIQNPKSKIRANQRPSADKSWLCVRIPIRIGFLSREPGGFWGSAEFERRMNLRPCNRETTAPYGVCQV